MVTANPASFCYCWLPSPSTTFIGCSLIEHKSKALLTLGIAANVVAIGYFKYANFLIENTNSIFHSNIALANIALPLGISFYTFQKIAFLVEALPI
jgi:alginate O-acetyltransferase complex protein AlgI